MRVLTKGSKRRLVTFATPFATLLVYFPLRDFRWALYLALCVGYSVVVFGLAWSDGKMHVFFGNRSAFAILRTHLAFLLSLIFWIWLAQFSKPSLPGWVTAEGDRHESWYLLFVLLGIIGLLLFEHWWFSKAAKRDAADARELP